MGQTLVENLARSAENHGARCAIEAASVEVSYETLWKRAIGVAESLAPRIERGDRVAIVLPNGVDYVISYYGALLAGAVAVPMNTAAKAKDVFVWLEHCGARWAFVEEKNAEVDSALQQLKVPLNVVRTGRDAPSAGLRFEDLSVPSSKTWGGEASRADDPATILYTSGTTGRPKGVLLSHANLASNAESIVSYLKLSYEDSIVTVLPFYYSYGSSVLHSHLSAGARLILQQNFVYPHAVVDTIAKRRSTGFAGVPSTYALLLSRVNLAQYDLSSLRYVTQAGGAMAPALGEKLRAALPPGVDVIVMYGQTEATARLTYLPPINFARKAGSVGVPIPGVRIEIRTDDGAQAPPDEVGEIWAHGPNVMLGYWADPAATSAVLRDGWLKTGDMGYLDRDGYLFVKGRRSDIIKVGAHRIHPKEVEEVIAELPGVDEVAVVGMDDEMLGQVIKVFVVPAAENRPAVLQIQAHCKERLASYKVPKYVEFVSALPKTASGKVRRAELSKGV